MYRSFGFRRPALWVGIAVAASILAVGPARAVPTLRFASSQFSHREMYTQVRITIVVEDRGGQPVGAEVLAEPGTATPDVDFVPGYVTAHPSADDTLQAFVRIYQDTDPEGPETIRLSIADGFGLYEIGHPGTATLTIVDDDVADVSVAYFEIADDIPLDPWGRIAVLAEPGAATEVDVVVFDLPPGGTTIHYTSTVDDQIHALTFTNDPRRTIVIPPQAIPPGGTHVLTELQILNPPAFKSTSGSGYARGAIDPTELSPEVKRCFACWFAYLMFLIDIRDEEHVSAECTPLQTVQGSFADLPGRVGAPGIADDLTILARYRDEVLAGAPGGAYYVQLYEDFSEDIVTAILQRPTLVHRVADTWDLWVPAVAAQVDGQGATFVITAGMQAALLGVMAELEELGTPELASLIDDFRVSLDLENVAGTTAADLQQAIENNPMEAEKATWGGVKAMYR